MIPDLFPIGCVHAARCRISDRSRFLTDLRRIADAYDTRIICFNADLLAGRVHAALAVTLAERAFRTGKNISNSIEMEALLYASGSRQCNGAAAFGIQNGENRVCLCCLPDRDGVLAALEPLFCFVREDLDVIGPEKRGALMRAFDISAEEAAAAGGDDRIVDLVLERVALLEVLR